MPMMKVTYFFQQNRYGWSESIHNLGATYDAVVAPAAQLRDARIALLPSTAKITYIRISNDLDFRDSVLINEKLGVGAQAIEASDPTFTACLLRLTAGPTIRRSLYMRPAEFGEGEDGDSIVNQVTWLAAFQAWRSQILNLTNQWAIRTKSTSIDGLQIQTAENTIPGLKVTIPGHTFTNGSLVTIRGFKGATHKINGTYKVASVAGDVVTMNRSLAGSYAVIAATIWGLAFSSDVSLQQIVGCSAIRVVSRKTGRPFDSPRGRKSRVR